MKKFLTLSLSFMLAACALHQGTYKVGQANACPCRSQATEVVPCQTCESCQYKPDPCREVLRPRITTMVTITQTCRSCPVDNQAIICGNKICPTFKETVPETTQYTIPPMPEAYQKAAQRTYTRIESTGNGWCTNKPGIYVENTQVLSADLPSGTDSGVAEMKRQISNGTVFTLANSPQKADYTMQTTVDWFDTPSKTVPAIKYSTVVYDKKHNRIGEWVEILKFADNQYWL